MVVEVEKSLIENEAKKMKLDDPEVINCLKNFEFFKVLNEDSKRKLVFIHAKKRSSNETTNEDAVIILEKPHFGSEEIKSYFESDHPSEIYIQNDIYNKLSVFPLRPFNSVQVQLIYPATASHIAKYMSQEFFFLDESYEDYKEKTLKFIESSSFSLQWVYNILEHKTEEERIIYEDPDPVNGFILLPDMKWDSSVVENLYLLAIVHQKGIKSLRDLNQNHIQLLENIRDKSFQAIEKKFGVKKDKLRAFIHYQPSFYHLHIHFSHIRFETPGMPERNYQLNQVIENLKLNSEYYQKVTLQFVVKKHEKIYEVYRDRFE